VPSRQWGSLKGSHELARNPENHPENPSIFELKISRKNCDLKQLKKQLFSRAQKQHFKLVNIKEPREDYSLLYNAQYQLFKPSLEYHGISTAFHYGFLSTVKHRVVTAEPKSKPKQYAATVGTLC
jgi:hypothetical protein